MGRLFWIILAAQYNLHSPYKREAGGPESRERDVILQAEVRVMRPGAKAGAL